MLKLMEHQLIQTSLHSLASRSHQTERNDSPEVTAIYAFDASLTDCTGNSVKKR